MSPPSTLHRPEQGASAFSSGFKVFFSASILFFGAVGTLPFLLEKAAVPVPSSNERIATASTSADNVSPVSVSAKIGTLPNKMPLSSVAENKGKIAQAYPEPLLVSVAPPQKTERRSSEIAAETAVKSTSVSVREFASIHSFTTSTTTLIGKTPTSFDKRPESIDSSKIADALLPMFHFAENLKPLSEEKGERAMPENPFRQLKVAPMVPREDSQFRPLRTVVELRPLRILESPPAP